MVGVAILQMFYPIYQRDNNTPQNRLISPETVSRVSNCKTLLARLWHLYPFTSEASLRIPQITVQESIKMQTGLSAIGEKLLMVRPKAFDRETVLRKAMQIFWEKGYEATSIQDLVKAMGIRRGSLYDTFQDKRHLFLEAIAFYHSTIVEAMISPLLLPDASRPDIEQHFLKLLEETIADPQQRGCFITNTVTELAAKDTEIKAALVLGLMQVENAFHLALISAQGKGEIAADKNTRALAHYLTSSIQGLRVMSKLNPEPTSLRRTVALILQVLD